MKAGFEMDLPKPYLPSLAEGKQHLGRLHPRRCGFEHRHYLPCRKDSWPVSWAMGTSSPPGHSRQPITISTDIQGQSSSLLWGWPLSSWSDSCLLAPHCSLHSGPPHPCCPEHALLSELVNLFCTWLGYPPLLFARKPNPSMCRAEICVQMEACELYDSIIKW